MNHNYLLKVTLVNGQLIEFEVTNQMELEEFIESQSNMMNDKIGTLVLKVEDVTHQIAVDKIMFITTKEI